MKDELIESFFPEEYQSILKGHCPSCDKEITAFEFRDVLSIKEFSISGLCQKCQNEIF